MAEEITILQHWIFTKFALPFLLIFFIVYGVLAKTKLLGSDNKQLNAMISFVIGLIFVGFVYPKLVVTNMVLFLTVAIVVMFVALLLWGFFAGDKGLDFEKVPKGLKRFIGVVIVGAVLVALLWAMGAEKTFFGGAFDFLFKQSWSTSFWTNAAFIVVIMIAVGIILGKPGTGAKG